jgi:hypothetical protein
MLTDLYHRASEINADFESPCKNMVVKNPGETLDRLLCPVKGLVKIYESPLETN